MGACASKPKRKSGNPKDKDKARHKEEDEFHDIKNEKVSQYIAKLVTRFSYIGLSQGDLCFISSLK